MWNRELEISKGLAVKAGIEIMDVYKKCDYIEIQYKDGDMPVTVADKIANRLIVKGLKSAFPDYAVLSEEQQENGDRLSKDRCFIVDPLDGTKEFIKRNGQFTVNIALSYKGKAVMGVIYVPATKELYFASEGNGAYLKYSDGIVEKLHVSDVTEKQNLRVVMSCSHECQEMDDLIVQHGLKKLIRIGSSLKGCLVAKGKAEIYYRFNPTMEWDTAAMQCIVEEAGGIFKQLDDSEMRYNREDTINVKGFYIVNKIENKLI